jgi:mRNA interferase MazF
MRSVRRGEVWLVDLGLAAKIRPCLVLGVPSADEDRSLVTVVPHTTSLRGPSVRLMKQLGILSPEQLQAVVHGVCLWLGIETGF